MMAAQLSTSLPSDSLLYSFTPAVCSRGGTPSPPPVVGSRRARTQSVTGESVQRLEVNDSASDLQLSPRSPSILHLPGRAPGGGSGIAAVARSGSADRQSMAATLASISIGPGNTNPNAAANATTPLSSSSTPAAAAAAAAPTAVASVMPLIVAGSSCCPGSAGSPRHPVSSSSSPTAASTGGLPKLEHPGGLHACGGNGGGVGGGKELPALIITGAGRRYSHSGGTEGCTAGVLESPTGGGGGGIVAGGEFVSGVAAVASRQGMLAPLRAPAATSALHADVVSAGGGGGGGGGGAKSQGWCGGGGAGGSVPSSSRRSSIAGPLDIGPIVLPCGISSPYTAACDVPSPVTPSPAASPAPLLSPPGRHPGPMAPLPGSPTTATAAMHCGRGLRADCSEGGPAATAADDDDDEDDEACDGSSGDNLYGGSSGAGGGSTSSTIAHLRSINDDLQRAAGALSALHALPTRSRSDSGAAPMTAAAASSPPPPPPAALTGRQLQALKESAPELHSELRIAVRRAFQVICQEVARSAPRGRKLGSCVHECWATLDAFLEGTAELTSFMVENALAAAAVAPAGLSPHPPSAATSGGGHHGSGCHGVRHHPSCGTEGAHSHDPVREVERMRAANMDLRQQLEECQARLATAEATSTGPAAAAASTPGKAGGAHTGSTRAGCKGGGGTCPRPPAALASPPQETCPGTSPRRGRHARAQQQQQQPRRESDPGVPSSTAASGSSGSSGSTGDPGDGGFVSAGGGAPCAPREGRGAVLARTGSVVESCSGGRQVTFAAVVAAGNGSSGGGVESPRLFGGRTTQLTSSSSSGLPSRISSHAELVIEDDSSEEEAEEDGEEGTAAAGSSLEARRRRGLMHSASFAEWMEGRMAAAAAARRR